MYMGMFVCMCVCRCACVCGTYTLNIKAPREGRGVHPQGWRFAHFGIDFFCGKWQHHMKYPSLPESSHSGTEKREAGSLGALPFILPPGLFELFYHLRIALSDTKPRLPWCLQRRQRRNPETAPLAPSSTTPTPAWQPHTEAGVPAGGPGCLEIREERKGGWTVGGVALGLHGGEGESAQPALILSPQIYKIKG